MRHFLWMKTWPGKGLFMFLNVYDVPAITVSPWSICSYTQSGLHMFGPSLLEFVRK